jgi:hypothetical protein
LKKPLVTNAADEKQLKNAEAREKLLRDQELSDLALVASTSQGRRFLWRMLERTRVFESIWENSARIHYNSGQQDFGHFLMSEIIECKEEILFQMMKENKREQV